MTGPKRIGSLQIVEDLAFQRRSWTIQRIGWSIMALLVIVSLAGIFGSGPLSAAQARSASGDFRMHYERFTRYQAPAKLRIEAGAGLARDGIIRVSLHREFVDAITIRHLMPPPLRVEAGADRVAFVFQVDPGGPLMVNIQYEPDRVGLVRVRAAAGEGSPVGFTLFVYP